MKPERAFVADRIMAQHSADLMRPSADTDVRPADLVPGLARAGDKLARALASALAPLLGGEEPIITCAEPRETDSAALLAESAPLAANSLLSAAGAPLVATIDAAAVLRIVDRTFGGKGIAPSPLPATFPLSAEIMVNRLEALVCRSLGDAFALSGTIEPVRHNGRLDLLEAFTDATPLVVQTLTIEEPGQDRWQIALALPLATMATLFGDSKAASPLAAAPRAANPVAEPFGDLPLTISAVVVDMRLPMSALAALQPGSVLPVSVARNVPLRIGDKTIAHGSIGALDDRVAIQITQAF